MKISKKDYLKNKYFKYWINERKKSQPYDVYDVSLCELMQKQISNNSKVLDVGVGTGVPFAKFFEKNEITIVGIDISKDLINECKNNCPSAKLYVGEAENLPFKDNLFDLAYCFHSSWYFDDLEKVIKEMLRVVDNEGYVFIDIASSRNKTVNHFYNKRKFENNFPGVIIKIIKNLIKFIIRSKKLIEWEFVIHFKPSDPIKIYDFLKSNHYLVTNMLCSKLDNSKEVLKEFSVKELGDVSVMYPRIVFVLKKREVS